MSLYGTWNEHNDVIKCKHFPCYWPFVRGIHRSQVNSSHKGQWRRALMFSLICAWINSRVNNHEAGDLRCHCTIIYFILHHTLEPLYKRLQRIYFFDLLHFFWKANVISSNDIYFFWVCFVSQTIFHATYILFMQGISHYANDNFAVKNILSLKCI